MTGLPDHPLSGGLALLALCGDLVIAIDAMSIYEIRRTEHTTARAIQYDMLGLDLEGQLVPGWDLGELLGIGPCAHAWAIVDLPGGGRRVGFRIGRCFMVQPLPVCRAISPGILLGAVGRLDAIVAGFSVASIPELAGYVSGVVIDLARVLSDHELAALAKLGSDGRGAIVEA
jgi:hypothetical protein